MPFYIFAWIGVIAYGFMVVVGKLTSKHAINNPYLFNYSWTLLTLIFTVPIAIYYQVGMPNEWYTIFTAAFFNSLWFIFFALATYRLDVSILSPLYNFRTVFAVILSTMILGEKLNPGQFIYFILIIIGGLFASIDEKFKLKSFFSKAIFIGISGMFFLALNNVFVKIVLLHNKFWDGTLWMLIISQIMMLTTFPFFINDLKKITLKQINPLVLMGLLSVLGNICLNIAYKENVTITSLIAAIPVSMLLAFLFSIFAPKLLEKHSLKVYAFRFTAAAIMIFAALKLSS